MDEVTLKVGDIVSVTAPDNSEMTDYIVGHINTKAIRSGRTYVRLDAKFKPTIQLYIREKQ